VRAKGCHLERGSHQRTPFGVAKMRGLSVASPPASADLEQYTPPVVDQTVFSGCEGASGSGAIYTTLAKAGNPLPWVPSQSDIYRVARCIDRGGSVGAALEDQGTFTNSVERALGEFGIRAMGASPDGTNCDFTAATINAEPTLGELEQDALTLLVGTYAINSLGFQKVQDVKLALASGFAVRVDTEVDQRFENWSPSQAPYGVPDYQNSLGGHAVYLTGYRGDVFVLRNSWGKTWGISGNMLVSAAFIQQADCYAWSVRKAAA
jgi:hypothetical protein